MLSKNNQYFPNISKTACQLKWTWSTVDLKAGLTNSCHRCLYLPLTKENINNFHNLPFKLKEREIMQKGLWPTKDNGGSGHCKYCKDIEDKNGTSDRINFSTAPNIVPKELLNDIQSTVVTPKILEIYINSKCNLKCTYCSPFFSSTWEKEIKQHGELKWDDGTTIRNYKVYNSHPDAEYFKNKMLEWIEKNGHELERVHLLGGETFYQPEIYEFIKSFSKIKNKRLQINIVSNFMVKEKRFLEIIQEFEKLIKNKCIGRLDLTASIDGFGDEAEYTRHGLNFKHFNKLFDIALSKKWITLNINQSITALTMRSMHKLHAWLNEKRKIKLNIRNRFMKVTNRPYLSIDIFGKEFWEKDIEKILSSMSENNDQEILEKKYMNGILNTIPDIIDKKSIKQCHYFLDLIDKRRETNWRTVFPYLDI